MLLKYRNHKIILPSMHNLSNGEIDGSKDTEPMQDCPWAQFVVVPSSHTILLLNTPPLSSSQWHLLSYTKSDGEI